MYKGLNTNNFTLVLSGGGALGIAHLGVLHDLEENDIAPCEIVGTSMGGVIGACMAIGLSEKEIYAHIEEFSSVSKWIKFSLSGNAIIDNSKLENIFTNIFHDKKMHETLIPLKLIATDLITGDKRVFGPKDDVTIKDAVLSTMAIPGIFDEHIIEGRPYGDGFLCENLGISEAGCVDVLAVDVLGKNSFHNDMPNNFFKTANVISMFEKSMRFLIYNQTRTHLLHSDKKIMLLEPDTKSFATFHFHKYDEIRALGLGLL
jgi:NTE family protein